MMKGATRMQGWVGALAPVAVAVWVAGCPGSSTRSDSSSSSGGTSEPPVVKGYRSFLQALCEYHDRCEASRGALYTSLDACRRAVEKELVAKRHEYDIAALTYQVDDARLAACTAGLATASCTDRLPPEIIACQDALQPRTPRDVGQACSTHDIEDAPRCVNPGSNWCNASAQTGCGTCAVKRTNGEDCALNDQCQSGYCNTLPLVGTNKCEALPAGKTTGQGCLGTFECHGNLVCAGPLLGKTCQARAVAGGECRAGANEDKPQCLEDLVCVAGAGGMGVCQVPGNTGQTCGRTAGTAGCADACVFAVASATEGVCQPVDELPAAGEPCLRARYNGYFVDACVQDGSTYPQLLPGDGGATTGCACTARKAAGQACREDVECLTADCNNGTCAAAAANGASCTSHAGCTSGYCAAGTCATPMSCG